MAPSVCGYKYTYSSVQSNATHLIMSILLSMALLLPLANTQQATEQVRAQVTFTMRKMVEECREETGATEADFEAMVRKEAASNMQAKCLRACLMKRFGLMDANGKFDKHVALQIASDHIAVDEMEKMRIAEEIVEICHNLPVSRNHCEAAEEYGRCASDYVATRNSRYQRL